MDEATGGAVLSIADTVFAVNREVKGAPTPCN